MSRVSLSGSMYAISWGGACSCVYMSELDFFISCQVISVAGAHSSPDRCHSVSLTCVTSAAPLILAPVKSLQHSKRLDQNALLLLQDNGKISWLAEVLTHNVTDKVPHCFAGSITGSWKTQFNLVMSVERKHHLSPNFDWVKNHGVHFLVDLVDASYQKSGCPHPRWWGVGGHVGKPLSHSDSLICESNFMPLDTEHQLNKSSTS